MTLEMPTSSQQLGHRITAQRREVRERTFEHALLAAIIGLNPYPNLLTFSLILVGLITLKLMRDVGKRWGFPGTLDPLALVGNLLGGISALVLSGLIWLIVIVIGISFPLVQPFAISAAMFAFVWVAGQATNQYYEVGQLKRLKKQETAIAPPETARPDLSEPAAATSVHAVAALPIEKRSLPKLRRRQLLLAGLATGAALTGGHHYWQQQQLLARQARLSNLARQSPTYIKEYLETAFAGDAKMVADIQNLQKSLIIAPPKVSYEREISKQLILCTRLATEQYLTGTIVENYDGSIKNLPSYEPQLNRYQQLLSIEGPEEATTTKTVKVPENASKLPQDPLREGLDNAENLIEGLAGQAIVLKWLNPVYWGFVLVSPEHSLIVFRGTQRITEWIQNILAQQNNYSELSPFQYIGRVHRGFATIYGSIAKPTIEAVQKLDLKRPIYITGHSLGASIATLAAMDIAMRVPEARNQLRLYTYASPRVGDPIFAQQHSRLVPNSYRVVNVADAIPLAPPTFTGNLSFAHVGQPWTFMNYSGDIAPSHFISTYRQAIDKGLEKVYSHPQA
ncbi:MAG TPA: DUF2974 domain-containing protein [Leptolyngbyaceae cyanobacterium M33_DOE_097]|uniref:DUF2974 domain-containing protein n=1 Tax=Oscillatoriales cyanobacterium SpSt-418 TaxID=2282169 RepID=A0A7C3PUP2_9CYAN|nr:DUF2974 domain-containing protein [Leptolyngbyaceae cyanobacterium M33_DOE_097]